MSLRSDKTAGNPFFAVQFISTLAEEGLLTFDRDAVGWSWDLDRIHAKKYTDNVVDLMVGKLVRLPARTREALQQLACLGNIAEITMLSTVLGTSEASLQADLWEAVRTGLVFREAGAYKFLHDRIQQAAYTLLGIDIPAHPSQEQVRAEYETVWRSLGGSSIETLIELALMTDSVLQSAMQVLSTALGAVYFTDLQLFSLLACRMVNLSKQHGVCGASTHGFAYLGGILGPVFHRYREGYRLARVACDVVEKHGFVAYQAKVYHAMAIVALWTQPISTAVDFNQAAFRIATETGDLTSACYSMARSVTVLILRNDPLDVVWRESERSLEFARKAGFRDVADRIVSQQRFIAAMQGRTASLSNFNDAQFDQSKFEALLTADRTALMVCFYWIVKLQAGVLSGEYREALAAAGKAKELLWSAVAHIQMLDYFYYTALAVTALYENAAPSTPTRIAVLKLLASLAAISLENTRLYGDLEQREAKIRRLVDANIVGIFIGNIDGEIVETNEAFLRMVGYNREDFIPGRLHRSTLTPAEWRDRDQRALAELRATGTAQPSQKEFFRKDGSRVPVMLGAATFEGNANEGVAFVLDLSGQKHAEEALQKAQAELAHMTRILTVGELTASIAHEISQPLAAIVTNGNAGLRWLSGDSPNLEETSQAIRRIIGDGQRASEVVSRIRALFKKAPTVQEVLEINEVIQEVLAFTQNEVHRNRVSLKTQLASDLPLVIGDRVQLQQVILNLILNAIQAMSGTNCAPRELKVISAKAYSRQSGANTANDEQNDLAGAKGAEVSIIVQDSGPGFDPQNIDRLFNAFYTTKPQGLGMGLSISRSIIEAHGGRLWAEANTPRGAVFQFTLPAAET